MEPSHGAEEIPLEEIPLEEIPLEEWELALLADESGDEGGDPSGDRVPRKPRLPTGSMQAAVDPLKKEKEK